MYRSREKPFAKSPISHSCFLPLTFTMCHYEIVQFACRHSKTGPVIDCKTRREVETDTKKSCKTADSVLKYTSKACGLITCIYSQCVQNGNGWECCSCRGGPNTWDKCSAATSRYPNGCYHVVCDACSPWKGTMETVADRFGKMNMG